MDNMDLLEHTDTVNGLLARYGVRFGIYKNNTFKEQLFPFDAIPRIIEHDEFSYLEKGLKQRVMALNLFLKDIYRDKRIVKDKVVPEDFIFASSGYMVECEDVTPVKGIYSHISGIDPCNNNADMESYIKVGVGRDASECLINRGVMHGGGEQQLKTFLVVTDIGHGSSYLHKGFV